MSPSGARSPSIENTVSVQMSAWRCRARSLRSSSASASTSLWAKGTTRAPESLHPAQVQACDSSSARIMSPRERSAGMMPLLAR